MATESESNERISSPDNNNHEINKYKQRASDAGDDDDGENESHLNSSPILNSKNNFDCKTSTVFYPNNHNGDSVPSDVDNENLTSMKTRESTSLSELEDSELGALKGVSDSPEIGETPSDFAFTKTKRMELEILSIIKTVKGRGSSSIDLSHKCLRAIPDELQELPQLEYMHLEGNEISFLPDEFFKWFPKIRWLDLRRNCLSRIPTVFLANHSCLRNLLLEGNNIRSLPLELGLVKSIHGLNIAGNPIEFPPQDIIDKGASHILHFLVEMIEAKSNANMADLDLELSKEVPEGVDLISASSDDWNTTASMMDLAKRRQLKKHNQALVNGHNELSSLGTKSVELHQPANYSENKVQHLERLKKAGALGAVEKTDVDLPDGIFPCQFGFIINQSDHINLTACSLDKHLVRVPPKQTFVSCSKYNNKERKQLKLKKLNLFYHGREDIS